MRYILISALVTLVSGLDCEYAMTNYGYSAAMRVACDGTSCAAPACPPGFFTFGRTCAYRGDNNQILSLCAPLSIKLVVAGPSISGTVDEPSYLTAKLVTAVAPNTQVTDIYDTVTANVVLTAPAGFTLDPADYTISGSGTVQLWAGIGFFSISTKKASPAGGGVIVSLTPRDAVWTNVIAATSDSAYVTFDSGIPITIKLTESSSANPTVGQLVTLAFTAYDQFGNIATSAVGQLVSLNATPSAGVYFQPAASLTFTAGVAQTSVNVTTAGTVSLTLVQGAVLLAPPVSFETVKISLNYSSGSPALLRLTIAEPTLNVGRYFLANVTLFDRYDNVATRNKSNVFLQLSDGNTLVNYSGQLSRGSCIFNLTWATPGVLNVTVLRFGDVTIPTPTLILVVGVTSPDYVLIIGLTVGGCCLVALAVSAFFWRRYKRKQRDVEERRAINIVTIHAELIKNATDNSTTESAELASATEVNLASRVAQKQVEQTQMLLMKRLAQLTASGTGATSVGATLGRSGTTDLPQSSEEALGVAGFLNKVRDNISRVLKAENPEDSKAEAAALNELLDSQAQEFLTPQEIQGLKLLCSQVITDLLAKRSAAADKVAKAEAKLYTLTAVTHATGLADLLASQAKEATSEEADEVLAIERPLEEMAKRATAAKAALTKKWDSKLATAQTEEEKQSLLALARDAFSSLDADSKAARDDLRIKLRAAAEARAQARVERDAAAVSKLLKKQQSEELKVLDEIEAARKEEQGASVEGERVIDANLVEGPLVTAALTRSAESALANRTAELKRRMQLAADRAPSAAEKDELLRGQASSFRRLDEVEEQERQAVKSALKERLSERKKALANAREARIQAEAKLFKAEAMAAKGNAETRSDEQAKLAELGIEQSGGFSTHAVNSALNASLALSAQEAERESKIAALRLAG